MALTRREVLKLGGLGTVAAMLPALRELASPAEDTIVPLDRKYLAHGLDVLCSAHASDPFATGHAGGAILSAYYFCGEEALEPGTTEVIRRALDHHYGRPTDLFPKEAPLDDGIAILLRSMEAGIDQLWRDGHNIIFLSLALKAFHDLPEAVTPSRVEALRRTLRGLQPRRAGKGDVEIPESTSDFAEFVLDEFLGSTEGGPGQGYAGHLLTNGRAILDLRELGHEPFAAKCRNAFQLYVKSARPKARHRGYREARPPVEFLRPRSKEYWVRRVAAGTLELGHLFKYPYGFHGLRRHSKDAELNEVCLANSYRLFRS